MLRNIAKAAAYAKAPKATFAVLHPFKAVKYGILLWTARKLFSGGNGRSGARA
ncbi:MAG: hypothetical protein WEB88_02640 [Gemmatimonadota bacterium]|jgi:hypothetical protein